VVYKSEDWVITCSRMKPFFALVLSLIFTLNGIAAEEKPISAFKTVEIAKKQLGKFGTHLLEVECVNAKLRPRYWWIRFYDDSLFLKVRAVQMIGPEMIRNMEPANPFAGGNVDYIISPESLKYDSDRCIAFIERAAKENNIPLHSLNIRLKKPHPGESNPIWYFEWFDEKGDSLGKLNISATTGRVTEVVGLKIKDPKFGGVSRKKVGEEIEETFLGIGADLEEFFTGKRTVDKPESGEAAPKKE
jgi:hypothetical protein